MIACTIPLRTGRGLNDRHAHYGQRSSIVKKERQTTAWALVAAKVQKPPLPCFVTLTRLGPSNGLDSDGLQGSLKGIRDQIAEWLGVDDRQVGIVSYHYKQARAKEWSVRVEFEAAT